jgi:citrate lyase subunit beta/citryl-CoA lyase
MAISRNIDDPAGETATASHELGLAYPRSAVAVATRAAGVHALDTPFTKFTDSKGLRTEANLAKSVGYKGKLAIHPAQVEIIESVFRPSHEEIVRARQVLKIAADAEAAGRGTASMDGVMIDMPVILRAQNIIRDARQGM